MSLRHTLADAARLADRLRTETGVEVTLVVTPTGIGIKGEVDFRAVTGTQKGWVSWELLESDDYGSHLEQQISRIVDKLKSGPVSP